MKKSVIVTGGSRGIGAEISRSFYREGYHVLIAARTNAGRTDTFGHRVRFQQTDARKEEDHQRLAATMMQWTNRIDVYINCAGISQWSPIEKIDEEFWNRIIDTNLKGTLWGCKVAAGAMRRGGSIINVSSIAGKRGSTNNSVYCASKFGVTGLTQSLAKELGGRGIRVNAVCPVLILTPGLRSALQDEHAPARGRSIAQFLREFSEQQAALKRLPTALEVANVCLFLASDAASAITGQSINVDCGVLPQ